MARSEARLQFGMWLEGLDGYSAHAKLMYAVLLTEDTVSQCGVGRHSPSKWAREASLTMEEAEKALAELQAGDPLSAPVTIDENTYEVLIRTLIRHDKVSKQPFVLSAALDSAVRVRSRLLRYVLAQELRKLPPRQPDGVSKRGTKIVYPDPHACADVLDPPGSIPPQDPPRTHHAPSADPPKTLFGPSSDPATEKPFSDPPRRERGSGSGSGSGESPPVGGSSGTAPRKRGTRIPEDFAQNGITAEMIAWAREKCPLVDGARETEMFVNYWASVPGAKGLKLDWARTWRNRMLEQQQRAEQQRSRGHLRAVSGGHHADPSNGVFWEQ